MSSKARMALIFRPSDDGDGKAWDKSRWVFWLKSRETCDDRCHAVGQNRAAWRTKPTSTSNRHKPSSLLLQYDYYYDQGDNLDFLRSNVDTTDTQLTYWPFSAGWVSDPPRTMSADLFAAFGVEDNGPPHPAQPNISRNDTSIGTRGSETNTLPQAHVSSTSSQQGRPLWGEGVNGSEVLFDAEDAKDDDDFGAFETVGDANRAAPDSTIPQQYEMHHGTTTDKHVEPQVLVPDLLDTDVHVSQSFKSGMNLSHREELQSSRALQHGQDEKVLPAWDDDWGDFERTEPEHAGGPRKNSFDPVRDDKQLTGAESISAGEDDWEPFEDDKPSQRKGGPSKASVGHLNQPHAANALLEGQSLSFERPTNIPPPSSLLQLLSSVFEELHTSHVENTISKTALAGKVLVVFRTASRIVAGRTLRWKRDTILAQNMRIGLAGTKGGMKLATVNKSESAKDERDSQEMMRDWTKHVLEFNSILAQGGFPPHRMKLTVAPSLKTLKYGSTSDASKECALCGLKRTERLPDVDVDLDDLFGEFWTEHWGHKECGEFWYSFKQLLGQR